jgi:hypothetical protein
MPAVDAMRLIAQELVLDGDRLRNWMGPGLHTSAKRGRRDDHACAR